MINQPSNSISSLTKEPIKKKATAPVIAVKDTNLQGLILLLRKFKLVLELISSKSEIPGSFWGDSEAGLIANTVSVRPDTPVHSLMHETCHYICMDDQRRKQLDTDAAGDYDEENAVCYLQIILANDIPEMGSLRMMQDMDSWGYTFRLGSAQAWFENDADDARLWLLQHQIIDTKNNPTYKIRLT